MGTASLPLVTSKQPTNLIVLSSSTYHDKVSPATTYNSESPYVERRGKGIRQLREAQSSTSSKRQCNNQSYDATTRTTSRARGGLFYEDGRSDQLWTLIGQGRKDPFMVLPVDKVSPIVHEVLDYGFRYYWHGLTPRPGSSAMNPINQIKLQAMYSSKLAYFAYTLAVVSSIWLLLGPDRVSKAHTELLLTHRVATLRLINTELASIKGGRPSEVLIGAVAVMAANDPDFFIKPLHSRQSRFQSPLAKAQMLFFIGHAPLVSAHYKALNRLIHLRNAAWADYEDVGLAEICMLFCIANASISGTKPEFPIISRLQRHTLWSPNDGGNKARALRADSLTSLPSEAAGSLLQLPFHALNPCMLDVIRSMKQASVKLDHYHRGGSDAPDLANIISLRNETQHRLLSISPEPQFMSTANTLMYKICRLCLLIYSNMVVFPLPPSSGVESRLATSLMSLLASESQRYCPAWHDVATRGLLLWASVLGGISDVNDTHRTWFIKLYSMLSDELGILSWQQLETHLSQYLWLDFVLNKEAVRFWVESRAENAVQQISRGFDDHPQLVT